MLAGLNHSKVHESLIVQCSEALSQFNYWRTQAHIISVLVFSGAKLCDGSARFLFLSSKQLSNGHLNNYRMTIFSLSIKDLTYQRCLTVQRPQLIGSRKRLKTKLPPWGFEPRPQPAVLISLFVREIQPTSRNQCVKPLDQASPLYFSVFPLCFSVKLAKKIRLSNSTLL